VETVLFDLDGTLVDSIGLILASFRHTMAAHRDGAFGDRHWLQTIGQPLRVQLQQIAKDDAEADAMLATYESYYIAHHDDYVRPFPGIPLALDALRDRGVRMGIVSGKRRRGILRSLRSADLEAYFEVLVGADDHGEHKPHPGPILKAMETLGADPRRTAYVGDAPQDVIAARRAGVRAIACLWGPFSREELAQHQPDDWLESVEEIHSRIRFSAQ
jgi:pyrophosphatase PpaX